MPRLVHAPPKYRKHKATGQAVVTIQGRDFYLGPYRSKASKVEYDRLIGEWLAAGRPIGPAVVVNDLSMAEMLLAYVRFAKPHYTQCDGKPSTELGVILLTVKFLRQRYGHTRAIDFGPLSLKAVQQSLVETGLSRGGVNGRVNRIKRIFKWAVSEELIPPSVLQGLVTVAALRQGRCSAPEGKPVEPVDEAIVDATLPHMQPIVADMVRLQRLTGARPDEICSLRPADVDRSAEVWQYRPLTHKTQHRGKRRVIFIGPRGQEVLLPYLLRGNEKHCFSPAESEHKRRAEQHAGRSTPLSCGNRPGTKRAKKPKRPVRDRYDTHSYRRAIHRACDKAFPPPAKLKREELNVWQSANRWSPNQLRHSAATEIRRRFGLEASQVVLGHSSADVTQVYAERDLTLASRVMGEVG